MTERRGEERRDIAARTGAERYCPERRK